MPDYTQFSEDWYCNLWLNTEMALPTSRETVLGFFERIQKSYPSLSRFTTRDNGDLVLEEEKDQGQRRWVALEPRRICSGVFTPVDLDEALEQHRLVLDIAPYMLSVSPLDCEAMDLMVGFDFTYAGNHDELVIEALGAGTAFEGLAELPGTKPLQFEPSLRIGLDEEFRRQARVLVETRTTPAQVRRGDFGEDQISVYTTIRQYGGLRPGESYTGVVDELRTEFDQLLEGYVGDNILYPLKQMITAK